MPKKKWEKPKLTILSKGKPEEAVIMVCKWYQAAAGGSNYEYGTTCKQALEPSCILCEAPIVT